MFFPSAGLCLEAELAIPNLKQLGEDQILYSSDLPHGEGRHNAAKEILARTDLTETQKRKILYDNAVKFFGEPEAPQ